jgi:hypothetical protein
MAAPEGEKPSTGMVWMAVVGLALVIGLGLYFWLGPKTPVVAKPVETESTS